MMLEDVDRPLQGLQYIAEPLQKLVNDDILDLARKASFAFDHSIFKWQLFRDRLGLFDKDAWAKITLAELRTLSEYEFPTINPRTATESSGHEIAVDPKETKTGLTTATLMTQAILIILAAYFWVFQREAMLCDSFPAPRNSLPSIL